MALASGSRLGPYEITARIGVGGMGEVYRATDTNLKRSVAIKVLPESVAGDAERLARFQREAEVLASLNHPNIAQIHGLEKSAGTIALVMELVEGPTLADRIAQGAIPVDEALPIAKQIAEALEAAHEQGIIHRDLKPANVKLRPDGVVKVLDFGLAKALEPTGAMSPGMSQAPTITTPAMTQAGMILGTAAYMSPEQAKGRAVDKRSDVWAFGAVLYEMLTGTRAFGGDDITETLADVMRVEPAWDALPDGLSPSLTTFLKRCLQKDPRQRIRDIGDVSLALEGAFETGVSQTAEPVALPQPSAWRRAAVPVAALLVGSIAAGTAAWLVTRPVAPSPTRFAVALPQNTTIGFQGLAMSPDGRTVVFDASGEGGQPQLYRRRLDQLDAVPIPGTEGGQVPFFSPDGAWVGFFTDAALKKVTLDGRPPVTLTDIAGTRMGASWLADGTIVFATTGGNALWRVADAGGEAVEIEPTGSAPPSYWVNVLPDGEAALVTVWSGGLEEAQVAVQSLESGERETLLAGTSPRYASTGHIVYWLENSLWAVPFDASRRRLTGAPAPLVQDVWANAGGLALFALGGDGSLVYRPGAGSGVRTLVWVDRDGGQEEPASVPLRTYATPRISPDGTQVAFADFADETDVWIAHLARGTSQRLTFDPGEDSSPVWSADGTRVIFFSSSREGGPGIFRQAADGTGDAERLSMGRHFPSAVTPDGTRLLFYTGDGTSYDIWHLSLNGEPSPEPLLSSPFNEGHPVVSPDGSWMAFSADDSGDFQIYVRPFPDVDQGRWQISNSGGMEPLWSPDGTALFYRLPGQVMRVAVTDGPPSTWGGTEALLEGDYRLAAAPYPRYYDISPDGQRFLTIGTAPSIDDASAVADLVVVENWFEELRRLVPTD